MSDPSRIFALDESVYLIWSIEHEAWWAPNELGYTSVINEAGWYLVDDAKRILQHANSNEINEIAIPLRMLHRMGL